MTLSSDHKNILEQGKNLFSARKRLESFWQETANNFYPSMASFTQQLNDGDEYADHLSTSFPILARRSLGDAIAAFLRPRTLDSPSPGVWFSNTADVPVTDVAATQWLEFSTKVQRTLMYRRQAMFARSTKEADHSFVTFGQAPMSVGLNRNRNGLLYQTWHLKDVVWTEDEEGQINAIWRRWKATASQIASTFGSRTPKKVLDMLEKDPFGIVEFMHIVILGEEIDRRKMAGGESNIPLVSRRAPWVSIWIDVDHDEKVEEVPSFSKIYIIPRWVTIPGSQYATSPAVTVSLPDARLIQAITQTLLESGEKFADPPMIATQEAIRSDINLFPGGVTYVDSEYDERLGEVLRPITQGASGGGLQVSISLREDLFNQISKAFYLDTLSLPPADVREMTAFEVGQRMAEWIRRATPIFEPVEWEYNGQIVEETFDILMRVGAFGGLNDIPDSLSGRDVEFKFESPLHESADRQKSQHFFEAQAALAQAAQLDPTVVHMVDARVALRDVLKSIGVGSEWTRSDTEIDTIVQAQAEAQEEQAALEGTLAGSEVAKNIATASKDLATAGGEI